MSRDELLVWSAYELKPLAIGRDIQGNETDVVVVDLQNVRVQLLT
eukprot:CAMPEP_0197393490 /NCGR_PEP_ID=MMETSP1165-20131217/4346_1 /TAXON_ID=284809 /ORGANISM="Chrysocystis fragilis, Strain CCMP3189" /LENGTH=44 /DNA_ID= /DNA_START= /DNA_END= /DNA_ORIENTATION=